jgi:hypothetical protein
MSRAKSPDKPYVVSSHDSPRYTSRFKRLGNYLSSLSWVQSKPNIPPPPQDLPPLLSDDEIRIMNDMDMHLQLVRDNGMYNEDEHSNRIPIHLALAAVIFQYYRSHNRFNYFSDDILMSLPELDTHLLRFYKKYGRKRLPRNPISNLERLDILLSGMRMLMKTYEEADASFKREVAPYKPSFDRNTGRLQVARKIIVQLEYLLQRATAAPRKWHGGKTKGRHSSCKRRHNSGKRRHNSGKRRTHARN